MLHLSDVRSDAVMQSDVCLTLDNTPGPENLICITSQPSPSRGQ